MTGKELVHVPKPTVDDVRVSRLIIHRVDGVLVYREEIKWFVTYDAAERYAKSWQLGADMVVIEGVKRND